jgi:hypothetical protein
LVRLINFILKPFALEVVARNRVLRHPATGHAYEKAFTIEGETFYRFIDLDNFFTYGRWEFVQKYLELYYLRLTPENFESLMIAISEAADAGKIGLCSRLALEGLERGRHLSHVESAYHVAAQAFFKKGDDLREGVFGDELNRRIDLFKKKGIQEILFTKPLVNLLGFQALLKEFSRTSLAAHLATLEPLQSGQSRNWARLSGKPFTRST